MPFGCPGGTPLLVLPPTTTPGDYLEALYDALSPRADLVGAFGKTDWLWLDLAPEDAALPLAVLTQIDRSDEVILSARGDRPAVVDGHFQLAVYSTGRAGSRRLARQIGEAIEAASDNQQLANDEFTSITIARSASPTATDQLDPDRAPDGSDVWGHTLVFSFLGSQSS